MKRIILQGISDVCQRKPEITEWYKNAGLLKSMYRPAGTTGVKAELGDEQKAPLGGC